MSRLAHSIIILSFAGNWVAQSNFQFEHITTKAGLSQNTVLSIYQDRTGFMWFGTRDGLNQYDGKDIHIFNHSISENNTLSNSQINNITEDHQGNLWISTSDGLTRYIRETEKFIRYYIPNANEESYIFCAFEDHQNTLWVGAREGLFYFDREGDSLKPFQFPDSIQSKPDRLINCIYEDKFGIIWFGTFLHGVYAYNPSDSSMTRFNTLSKPSLNHNRVETITEDDDGNVWLGTYGGGINIWYRTSNSISIIDKGYDNSGLSSNLIRTLIKDENGNIWIGTFDGLNIYDFINKTIHLYSDDEPGSYGLNNSSIRSLFQDKNGAMWIGTYYGGINKYDPSLQLFKTYTFSSDSRNASYYNIVSSIVEDNERNLWIGTERGGLLTYNRKFNYFESFKPVVDSLLDLPLFTIKSMLLGEDNRLWVGTHRRGLYLFNIKDKKFTPAFNGDLDFPDLRNSIINYIFKDYNQFLWICTESYGGLYKYDTDEMRLVHFKLDSTIHEIIQNTGVRSVFQDDFGNFWIATKGKGIILYNEESSYIDNFYVDKNNPLSLKGNHVYHIAQHKERNIWISTYGTGIGKFDRISRGFDFSYSDKGLLHDKVFGILEDSNGILWISTIRGISRFDKQDTSFKNFDYLRGLPIAELTEGAFHKGIYSGNLYFGGIDGFMELNPELIQYNEFLPTVVITRFKLFNKDVRVGDETGILSKSIQYVNEIKLKYNQSVFAIDFIALNYTRPEQNEYAFMLEGLETAWNYVKNTTSATYTLLNPGEYIFKVKASNNDGIWNENPTTLKITVLHPPWKKWWAYILYIIIISLVLYFLRYFNLKREALKNDLLIKNIEQTKLNEINDAKIDFFTNISHEFRTPLTLIIGPLKELINGHKKKDEVRRKLTLVMQNAQLLNRLTDQLADFRKLDTENVTLKVSQNDWVAVTKNIYSVFTEYAKHKKINYSFKSDQREITGWIDTNLIEKALFIIISNAFNNTHHKGKIEITTCMEKYETEESLKLNTYEKSFRVSNPLPTNVEVVSIKVEDNGSGFSPKHLNRMFDKYYQIPGKISAYTGIGLFMVKNIVKLHHGCIDVYSEKEKGTIFCITIPIQLNHSGDNLKDTNPEGDDIHHLSWFIPADTETAPDWPPPPNAPMIHIIEDNYELSKFLGSILNQNYRIINTTSFKEARVSIQREIPDLIICDITSMKKMGINFCRRTKENRRFQSIPFIIITADASEENKLECFSAGADEYFVKPFSTDLLKERIRNLLSSRNYNRAANPEQYISTNTLLGHDEKLLLKINSVIHNNISDSKLNITTLGREAGLSRVQVYRKIKSLTGMTAVEYIRTKRIEEAANLLRQEKFNVNEIAGLTGFTDVDYFRKNFKKQYGVTPTMFVEKERRKKNR